MKAIKKVIGSYFVQPFELGFLFWGGLFVYFFALVFSFVNVDEIITEANIPFILFCVSIVSLSSFLGLNLRRVIQSPTSLLMPKYRQTHIAVSFMFIIPFILFPVIWFSFKEISPVTSTAVFFFIVISVLITTYRFSEQIVQFIFLLWLLKIGLQMLGFNIGPRIWGLSDLTIFDSKALFELVFISIIIIIAFIFYHYYLRVSIYKDYIAKHTDDGWSRNHDTGSKWQIKLINFVRSRMIKNYSDNKNNRFYQIRLMQYSLFSPFTLSASTVFVIGFYIFLYALTMIWQFYNFSKSGFEFINLIIYMTFVIFSLVQISDFLNHRNRISFLWMQSRSREKEEFLDNVFWSVVFNSMKYYITVSIFYLAVLSILSYSGMEVIAFLLLGLNFYLFVPALGFIFSDKIQSEASKGWNMAMMFLIIILINIGNKIISSAGEHLPVVIIILLITLIISFGLLILGKMKWRESELTLPGLS